MMMAVPLHFASFRHLSAMQPATSAALRIAFDIFSIWTSCLFAWFVVTGNDHPALMARPPNEIAALAAGFGLLASLLYAATGLYARAPGKRLSSKLLAIISVNFVLLGLAGLVLLLAGWSTSITPDLFVATFAGSTVLPCAARCAAVILRSEALQQNGAAARAAGRIEPDERSVLVIGGAGYIGSALVGRLLRRGLRVCVLDAMHFGEESLAHVAGHPRLTVIREDFRHIEALTRAMNGVGSVIHLGGLVGDPACAIDSDLTVDVNVTATKVIGEIAKASGVRRFIFASSCSVYGASDAIVDEGSRFNPQSLYARTKVASEAILGRLNAPGFAVTALRFATIYGISGRTRFDLVVNLLCAKAVRDGLITVFGADQWRPFVHVEDVAYAIELSLHAPVDLVAGEAFNVGSDSQNYTLGEVAAFIHKQVPEATIVTDDRFVDRRNYRVAFAKIRSRLGFVPQWTLAQGIAQVIARVRSNEVGHYALPTYSNVLYLQECGTSRFARFKLTGWEKELMNLDRIAFGGGQSDAAAA